MSQCMCASIVTIDQMNLTNSASIFVFVTITAFPSPFIVSLFGVYSFAKVHSSFKQKINTMSALRVPHNMYWTQWIPWTDTTYAGMLNVTRMTAMTYNFHEVNCPWKLTFSLACILWAVTNKTEYLKNLDLIKIFYSPSPSSSATKATAPVSSSS